MSFKPLHLAWKHNVYDGIPIPTFQSAQRFEEIKEKHKSRRDDIYIATFVKSGTTWIQHILNQMLGEPQGRDLRIDIAVPWLECKTQTDIDNMPSPRIFKTHDKWRWIPKSDGVKYIYCYRNPKDVAVSYYYHQLRLKDIFQFEGSFDYFLSETFIKKNAAENGWYFDHVSEWLAQTGNANILFVTYEDLVEDLRREILRIAAFLQCNLDDERIKRIGEASSFDSMKENDNVNYSNHVIDYNVDRNRPFIRKGIVGDWINHLSENQSEEIEKLVEQHLIPLGAKIRYTLP